MQGGLKVSGGGQHRKPRNGCQGRCSKEDWVRMSWWEDALGQLERWVPPIDRLLGVLGSLQWEKDQNPHRLDQNPCRLGQNQYRSLRKISQASRKVFILSMFWNRCPNLCFPVLICVSEFPVELGKPYSHPGSSLGGWDLMGISLRILLWATEIDSGLGKKFWLEEKKKMGDRA